MSEPTPLRPMESPPAELTDNAWLTAVMKLAERQAASAEVQTDRLVDAFRAESLANRQAVQALQKESRKGLAEVRSVVNRNTMALVIVALVGFVAIVAVSASGNMGVDLSTSGLSVTTEAAEAP